MEHEPTIRADVVLAEVRAGFDALNRRVDVLAGEVRYTNGKVTRAGQDISAHAAQIDLIHEEITRLRDAPLVLPERPERPRPTVQVDVANAPVTFASLKAVVLAIVATVAITFAVMTAFGWHR